VGKQSSLVVGLDIGTTKVSVVVGELTPEGGLEVIGVGHRPSKGLRKGIIVDIESTVDAITAAVEDAEVMAGIRINTAYIGIGGGQVEGLNVEGSIELRGKEVTPMDVQQVIAATRPSLLPGDREVLQVVPQEFTLDGEEGILDPVGRAGTKLGMRAQVITAATPALQTLTKVVSLTRIQVREIVAQQLASAEAMLTEDEKDAGVALIDIGGGTSDIAVYSAGSLQHISSLGVGGNHVTHDVAVGLRTPVAEAERLKKQYGCALVTMVQTEDSLEVPPVGGRDSQVLTRRFLAEIVEARIEEIFALALHDIQQSGCYEVIPAGLVLTGGASVIPGMEQAAEAVFELPVRLGYPLRISGLTDLVHNPTYATGVGLCLYGSQRARKAASRGRPGLGQAIRRMAAWLQEVF
jgi:cell division protein FtsA